MTMSWHYLPDTPDETRATRPPEAFVRFVWAISPGLHATPLGGAEEQALVVSAQGGDRDAAARLLGAHERFLYSMARKVARQNGMRHLIEDFKQTALTEFMSAITRYSAASDVRLATFARYGVAGALLRQALDFRHALAIGKSSDERKAYYNMRAAIDGFSRTHGRTPDQGTGDLGDLAGRLGVSPKACKRGAQARHLSTIPLHKVDIWQDGTADCPDVDRAAVRRLIVQVLREVMGPLNARDRAIVAAFATDPEEFDGAAIAARFEITPERVGQIRRTALTRMKNLLAERGLGLSDLLA